jgi:glycerol kinase
VSHPERDLVVAVDQGTSSTKAVVVDRRGRIVRAARFPVSMRHPAPGWSEQDANELWSSVRDSLAEVVEGIQHRIRGVGLSTQRESALMWDRRTGGALGPVIGWQDRRTQGVVHDLIRAGRSDVARRLTGLPLDPMFSAAKFRWLIDSLPAGQARAEAGDIAVGTVDSWLMLKLCGVERIEAGNASRTQLLDIDTVTWSDEMKRLYGVPGACLPTIATSDDATAIVRAGEPASGIPVLGVLGDSHAALFAHVAAGRAHVKATYGSGSSIMGLAQSRAAHEGLTRTIAWSRSEGPTYALEGNILSAGATLVWLGELLNSRPDELMAAAPAGREDSGVHLVPAFAGLGAPWWDEDARGALLGLDFSTSRADIARAAAESIVQQVEDVLSRADDAVGHRIDTIAVDGGPSSNSWLMQLQADVSRRRIVASSDAQSSAIGVAALVWQGETEFAEIGRAERVFEPGRSASWTDNRRGSWLAAVGRVRDHTPA